MARARDRSSSRCATSCSRTTSSCAVRASSARRRPRRGCRAREQLDAMLSEVSGVRSSCDSVATSCSRARLLVAQIGDVLQRQDQPGGRAVAGAERRRPQHEVVVAAAQEERDLDRSPSRSGCARNSRTARAHAQVVRMAWCRDRRSGGRAPRARSTSRIAHATSFTCIDTAAGSSTMRPSSIASMTASVFAFSSSTTSMRVRSIAIAAWRRGLRGAGAGRAADGVGPVAAEREHADAAARGVERDVEPLAAGQGLGAGPAGCRAETHGAAASSASPRAVPGGWRRARRRRPPSGSRTRRRRGEGSATCRRPSAAGRRCRPRRRFRGERVQRGGARLARRAAAAWSRARASGARQDRDEEEDRERDRCPAAWCDREGVDAARRRRSRTPSTRQRRGGSTGRARRGPRSNSTPARKTMAGSENGSTAIDAALTSPAVAHRRDREEQSRRVAPSVGSRGTRRRRRAWRRRSSDDDRTSMSPLPRDHVVDRRGAPSPRQPRRRGLPSTISVTLRSRAKRTSSSATRSPGIVTGSPPSRFGEAQRLARPRARGLLRPAEARRSRRRRASHSARRGARPCGAPRAPERSEPGPPSIATMRRSATAHTPATAWARM